MNLLIVDGSNLVMRSALGGELPPHVAVGTATGLVERAARQAGATHLVVALDSPAGVPSWRKERYPDYKANRTTDTTPWLQAVYAHWVERKRWWVEECSRFEADDIIATLARRIVGRCTVTVLSGDSDLLPLTAEGIQILKPVNGGRFEFVTAAQVCTKYTIAAPDLLVDLKSMTGESGDNVPGVDGIGPVRAHQLLAAYGRLDGVIAAGVAGKCKHSIRVAAAADTVHLARELVTLNTDAPVLPIKPSTCAFAA